MPTVSSCPSDSAHDLGQIAFSVGPALSYNEPSPQTVSSYLFVKYFDISDPKHGKKKKKKERKEKNTAVVTVHLKSQIKCVVGS